MSIPDLRDVVVNHNTDVISKFRCGKCLRKNIFEFSLILTPFWSIFPLWYGFIFILIAFKISFIMDFTNIGFWIGIGFFFGWFFLSRFTFHIADDFGFMRAYVHSRDHTIPKTGVVKHD